MEDNFTASWEALGTTALVRVTDPRLLSCARSLLAAELDAIDLAASRFRSDSELERVNANAGRFTRIGPLLHEAIAAGLRAAALTDGVVDPALGRAMRLAGYTRDYRELDPAGELDPAEPDEAAAPQPLASRHRGRGVTVTRAGGWKQIELSDDPPGVLIPEGMGLDLGATAKALCADRAARRIAAETGGGALVSLGGDISLAGPAPAGGWLIHVTDDHRSGAQAPGQTIALESGGLASSSTTTRRWRHDGRVMHHIIDPATGTPADGPWRTVSVAAGNCVDANIASTAAIVLGATAPAWLSEHGLAARLVAHGGEVRTIGGWPAEINPQ
ncbi:MAG: FAD:protein FMN transferase [Solirubrobacteraceae bacterium]